MKLLKIVGTWFCLGSFAPVAQAGIGPVPVAVVMEDGRLFFVIDPPRDIQSIVVRQRIPGSGPWTGRPVWVLAQDLSTPVNTRKYIKMGKIEYGVGFGQFSYVVEAQKLQPNVEYQVAITLFNRFANKTFTLSSDGKELVK